MNKEKIINNLVLAALIGIGILGILQLPTTPLVLTADQEMQLILHFLPF